MSILTDTRLGRYVLWRAPTNADHLRFPAAELRPSDGPFDFERAESSRTIEPVSTGPGPAAGSDSFEALLERTGTTAFVVISEGRIAYERYFNGGSPATVNRCFSVTKSFASALVGIAIDEGRLAGIDVAVSQILPEFAGHPTGTLTIRHLLEMRSGIRFVAGPMPWSDDAVCYFSPDCRAATRRAPVSDPVGSYFHYNDYHPFLIGMILEQVMGEPLWRTFESRLWRRIGARNPASLTLDSTRHGFAHLESGLNATALDLAKFGQLFLDGGRWMGEQIVSENWVRTSTGPEGARRDPAWFKFYEALPWGRVFASGRYFYKHFWWGHEVSPDDHAFFAMGALGQHIYVSPKHRIVIVRLSERFPKGMWWPPVFQQVVEQFARR